MMKTGRFLQQMKLALLPLILPVVPTCAQAQVLINEVCPHNASLVTDFQLQHEDWAELYNAGPAAVDLEGYGLSDKNGEPRFVFPSVVLGPGAHLLVFLSGKNLVSPEFHTSFKLRQGETLYLFDNEGEVADQLDAGQAQTNHSRGRFPDGATPIGYFDAPTPGTANGLSAYVGYTASPVFSKTGGFFQAPFSLNIGCSTPGAAIHYTTNGSLPTAASPVWTAARTLGSGRVIRARAQAPGLLPSALVTHTYLFDAGHQLPVVSIVIDSLVLFDTITGLFYPGPSASPVPPYTGANFWNDTEFPATFQLFEDEALVFTQDIGLSMHGGTMNRSQPMKSLRLSARKIYGENTMVYPFFNTRQYTEYKKLVLRNGSSDFCRSNMRDELVSDNLINTTHNDVLANRPCIVYINGAYWGLYHLREKRGRHNLAALHGVNADSLDILRDNLAEAWKGDTVAFSQLYQYVMSHDMQDNEQFRVFAEKMDMHNMADYFISEIFYGNFDWPYNNIEVWRERRTGSKFRYQLFDFDVAFAGTPWIDYHYSLWDKLQSSYCDTSYHVNLFEKALENRGFYTYYVNRSCDLLNTLFSPANQVRVTTFHREAMAYDMPRYFNRWGVPLAVWHNEMDKLNEVNLNRPGEELEHLRAALLPGHACQLRWASQPEEAGFIQLNTIAVRESPWYGNYFDSVPITMEAKARPGHVFRAWKIEQGTQVRFDASGILTLYPQEGMQITAIYTGEYLQDISVFPNPVTGTATVRVTGLNPEPAIAQVSDMTGRIVYAAPLDSTQFMAELNIDLSGYAPGIYIVQVKNGSKVLAEKIIHE